MAYRRFLIGLMLVSAPFLTSPVRGQSLAELAQRTREAREKAEADRAKAADVKAVSDSSGQNATKTDGAKSQSIDAASKRAATPPIYDEQSLKGLARSDSTAPATSAPASPTDAASGSATSPVATSKPGDVVKDEAWWKARMARLRAKLQQAQTEYHAMAMLVTRLEGVRDNVPEHGFSVAQAYAAATAELAKAKAQRDIAIGAMATAKSAIDAAEEEARVASVLPGWLR